MSIAKMKEIVIKEAYRPVKLRIGDKTITLPKIQAAARTHFLNAAEDDMKAFMAALRLVLNFESEKAEDQLKVFASALEYKSNMEKELARRKRKGITAPDPFPIPMTSSSICVPAPSKQGARSMKETNRNSQTFGAATTV